jgi:hypothetical protein
MSSFPFSVEKGAARHFKERLASLMKMDEVRVMTLLEALQYSLLYALLGYLAGSGLDAVFPAFNEKKPIKDVVVEVIGQTLSFVLLIFFIRKIVKLVPFLFVLNWDLNGDGKVPKYRPYETTEYGGEITIALVLIASQMNLLRKIDLLSRALYAQMMGDDTRKESALKR